MVCCQISPVRSFIPNPFAVFLFCADNRDSWWWVDMGNTYCVGKVVIFNRVDCCKYRLTGAVVRIGFGINNNTICGTVTSSMIAGSRMLEVTCALQGRYISIHLPKKKDLTLCEVEAYACR